MELETQDIFAYNFNQMPSGTNTRRLFRTAFILLISSFFLLQSCGTKKKKIRRLQNFDSIAWIEDRKGCRGDRLAMKDDLLKQKFRMRGLRSGQIVDILGKPDAEELQSRNQKYYIYFVEPGPDCSEAVDGALALYVRFTAVGIANEITLRRFDGNP